MPPRSPMRVRASVSAVIQSEASTDTSWMVAPEPSSATISLQDFWPNWFSEASNQGTNDAERSSASTLAADEAILPRT